MTFFKKIYGHLPLAEPRDSLVVMVIVLWLSEWLVILKSEKKFLVEMKKSICSEV